MKFVPLERPALPALVAGWLTRKDNCQCFDLGGGQQMVSSASLKIAMQNVNANFKSARMVSIGSRR